MARFSVRFLCCPQCSATLIDATDDRMDCSGCSLAYPVRDGVPVLLIGEATCRPTPTDAEFETLPGFGWDVGDSFRQAGLDIVEWTDYTTAITYHDVRALVYELLRVPWGVVDFDLDRYRERLFRLHRRMQAEGVFRTRACTNLIEACKP